MSYFLLKRSALGVAAAVVVSAVSQLTIVQASSPEALITPPNNNNTIFVDQTSNAIEGAGARWDRTAALEKSGARGISKGAIIHRSGNGRVIVHGRPPSNITPQPRDELHDWCPTCTWYEENKGSY
jgi:hypothetical protein